MNHKLRGVLFTNAKQKITYKSSVINSSQENEAKPFYNKSDLCDLDLWSKEHKIIRGKALTKTNKYDSVNYKTSVVNSSQDNEVKPLLYKSDPSDLDLWPNYLNVNMGHVSIKTNQHVKYEIFVINSSQDNDQKACVHIFTSDPCDLDL